MRVQDRRGITNGVALVIVILIIALPVSAYYFYFSKPITVAPSQQSGSNTTSTQVIQSTGAATGYVTGGVQCGFGLTYGSPGGEGCIVYMNNGGNSTLTATGTCNLTYGGTTYPGTFSYADALGPNQSTGKVTCGSSQEGPPAGAGTLVTGQVFFTNGQFAGYNGTAVS